MNKTAHNLCLLQQTLMVDFISKAPPIHFINDNNNYKYLHILDYSVTVWFPVVLRMNSACNTGVKSVIV